MRKPIVGVSACLLGERVRYDGDHRRSTFVAEDLGARFTWVVVCPEVEAGFGVPRETMRLEGDPEAPRLFSTRTREDRTARMAEWCRARVAALPAQICGFVLKRGSPSCGPERVKVYRALDAAGTTESSTEDGMGFFAAALRARFPGLPLADEERLEDPASAREFIAQVEERFRSRLTGDSQ